jgi:hypothetical protein
MPSDTPFSAMDLDVLLLEPEISFLEVAEALMKAR